MSTGEDGELVFAMGEFPARFPMDRRYAKNHMWAMESVGGRVRFGFSAYAVRLLQDVYFLEWTIEPGTPLRLRQAIGAIESKKAESDLFAPVTGTLVTLNQELLADPSAINVDKYGAGWLFELETEGEGLLTAEQYVRHLDDVWEVAQRTIKGQLNET